MEPLNGLFWVGAEMEKECIRGQLNSLSTIGAELR